MDHRVAAGEALLLSGRVFYVHPIEAERVSSLFPRLRQHLKTVGYQPIIAGKLKGQVCRRQGVGHVRAGRYAQQPGRAPDDAAGVAGWIETGHVVHQDDGGRLHRLSPHRLQAFAQVTFVVGVRADWDADADHSSASVLKTAISNTSWNPPAFHLAP